MFTHNLYVSMACLSAGFFFAEMTIGPMWAIPMDIAPEYSGTASGMMNTGSALAAIISPVVGGFLIDRFGNWELPFVGSMVLMAHRRGARVPHAAGKQIPVWHDTRRSTGPTNRYMTPLLRQDQP